MWSPDNIPIGNKIIISVETNLIYTFFYFSTCKANNNNDFNL